MLRQIAPADYAAAALPVQLAAYRQEAELINYPALPPLAETQADLATCREVWFGWFEGAQLAGLLGMEAVDQGWLIARLVVSPAFQRRGIGQTLVNAAIDHAGDNLLTVGTALANLPALQLYRRLGFRDASLHTLPDGLQLIELQRRPAGPSSD
ncbi:GNAT family N-acetyltransferase [Parachitinimonas caeni]|uniref:GNAT family N-acetyltransferase n=1 Tax=Parachitinimonas caeni TaxID=3031301 RepID=A0ABT7DUZ7_9NEIS|nr:GNAT family N-acetyltransferase [Parachitinimonas caeni]MDK2123885.1 GNAT family N-acetyltransferase [Parachitinimonas caeni]